MGYTPQQLREIAKVILAHGSLESTFDNFQTSSNEKVERKLAEAIDFYERTVPMEIRAEAKQEPESRNGAHGWRLRRRMLPQAAQRVNTQDDHDEGRKP